MKVKMEFIYFQGSRQLEKCITKAININGEDIGSIQEAFLFISYASTLDELVTKLTLNGFAGNLSVRRTFKLSKLGHKDELEIIAIIVFYAGYKILDGQSLFKDE